MVDTLTVHLSRGELHEVAPATADFETDGPFELEFVNHGRAAHVHVHPDDALARGVSVAESNLYVETESTRVVEVAVPDGPRPLRGTLDVSAGYGATEASVDVGIVQAPDPDLPVDETLAEPSAEKPSGSPVDALLDEESLPVLGLGAVALLLAVGAAYAIGDLVVAVGALAVLAGVAVAIYALVAE
ncbi:hypothetical protein G9C85_01090 [Halorubellus sp. JP-L1]|uniref:DUF7524 family protein n=1 Tax=Halorubellus sp. JP-L1 TaxID=2715753 RepID=UPI001409F534|nr:hypothetical protein [Halorubellus sp. JP-L1]NHN40230.1 hypothetical protein [Halorubellus sp. JP-L1]